MGKCVKDCDKTVEKKYEKKFIQASAWITLGSNSLFQNSKRTKCSGYHKWRTCSKKKKTLIKLFKNNQAIFDERPTRRTSVVQAFFRWVQAQGNNPDTTGGSKNASGPVGIPLKRAHQLSGDKPSPSKEG